MEREMEAWNQTRNQAEFGANWRFTTTNTRIKLKTLDPIPDDILR